LGERTAATDAQKAEIAALRIQVEALKAQLMRHEKDVKDTTTRLARERNDADSASKELSDERGKAEVLVNRVAQLERQLVAQTTEAEILSRRVRDLETRLADQGRLLVEREHAESRMRSQLDASRKAEAALRTELAANGDHNRESADAVRAENARLQNELARLGGERARLQQDILAFKRDAEQTRMFDRAESALLRDHIRDVAAEVAHLTMTLEGPNSPIAAMLAAAPAAPNGANGAGTGAGAGEADGGLGGRNLADRIRALKDKASRLSPAS
jgi:chromosome segregation ATPase